MGAPQVIMLVLTGFSMASALHQHGTPKTGKHDASIIFIALAIQWALLWWGGFVG